MSAAAAFVPLIAGTLPPRASATPARLKPISVLSETFEAATPELNKQKENSPSVATHNHGPPKVTLERQGDVVTHIRIECSCGQVTELACSY